MSNRDTLLNIIQNTKSEKKDLIRKIDKFLYNNFDSMIVKVLRDQLMQLNIPEEISDDKIVELIKLIDENIQIQPIKTQKVEDEKQIQENNTIQEAYNTMIIENETLRKTLKQKDTKINELESKKNELENQNKLISNRLDKLETFIERFKKYNITEFNELITLEDDTINNLYMNYSQNGTKQLNDGYIFETEDSLIIPKSYYRVEKEND